MIESRSPRPMNEFYEDSLHIKTTNGHSPTLDEMEETRQAYLKSHPAYTDYQFETLVKPRSAPTPEEVRDGSYIHDRWKSKQSQNISSEGESPIH